MEASRAEQNFGGCDLGDVRLNRRALSIGQALTRAFGQALAIVFGSVPELKRAYEFSRMQKAALRS